MWPFRVEKEAWALDTARENMSFARSVRENVSLNSSSSWIAGFGVIAGEGASVVGFVDVVVVVVVVMVCMDGEKMGEDFEGELAGFCEDGAAAALLADVRVVLIPVVISADGFVKKHLDLPYAFPLVKVWPLLRRLMNTFPPHLTSTSAFLFRSETSFTT
ncbi:hypothetical protein BU17DRAFT_72661 [Hysterangium stoloniferum]|nr:hypothetical protein BU17DRAFT_72661 [Hysterangium stoloniferum]